MRPTPNKLLHNSFSNPSNIVPHVGDVPAEFFPGQMEFSDDGVRHSARMFAEQHGPGDFGSTITRLHRLYEKENQEHFSGVLPVDPLIVIGPCRGLGWHGHRNPWGGQFEIGISKKLFYRDSKIVRRNEETEEGFQKFLSDILRHEMIHLHNYHIINEPERSFHGHGPEFAYQCNRIGIKLGLPPVRQARSRKASLRSLPSCSSWPHCVRPPDFYEGAWLTGEGDQADEDENDEDDLDANPMQYLLNVAQRCDPTDQGLRLLGQAAIIACRLRFGRKVLAGHSTEIPFSEFCVI